MIDMVFPTLDPTIREKVISAYLTGHGRNQIARELNEQGLKVSTASVTNFIKGYERQHQETSPIVATTNTTIDLNKGGSPSSIGDGLADSQIRSEVQEPDIDFSNTSYPDFYPDPQETVNIGPNDNNINQDVPQQNDTTEEKSSKANQSINTLSGAENQSDLEPLLIPDCNPDESHETILWKRIMAEKKQRQEEYQIIQREREMLDPFLTIIELSVTSRSTVANVTYSPFRT